VPKIAVPAKIGTTERSVKIRIGNLVLANSRWTAFTEKNQMMRR
jgi:hypothetical protein